MFWRLRKAYYKGIRIRLGFGCYFFQITMGKWWQLLLRIGRKAYVYNKNLGYHVRIFER